MKKIRIGKDFTLEWPILTNGDPVPLEGRDLLLELHSPYGSVRQIPFEVKGIDVLARIEPNMQAATGVYSLTLWENYGKDGQTVVDSCDGFQLVDNTCKEGTGGGHGHGSNINIGHVRLTAGEMNFTPIVIKEEGGSIVIDTSLSPTSENAVQNKVVTQAITDLARVDASHEERLTALERILTSEEEGIFTKVETAVESADTALKATEILNADSSVEGSVDWKISQAMSWINI